MAKYVLDPVRLHRTLDARRARVGLDWRDVARETGLSPSTFTRLGQGHRPDADALCTLMIWLGLSLREFIVVNADG